MLLPQIVLPSDFRRLCVCVFTVKYVNMYMERERENALVCLCLKVKIKTSFPSRLDSFFFAFDSLAWFIFLDMPVVLLSLRLSLCVSCIKKTKI